MSARSEWPHHGTKDGWQLEPSSGTVYVDSPGKHNLTAFAEESRKYIRARDQAIADHILGQQLLSAALNPSSYRGTLERPPVVETEAGLQQRSGASKTIVMKRGKRKRMLRRKRPRNAALVGRNLPFRMAVAVTSKDGLLTQPVNLKAVIVEYLKTFDEFKCLHFKVRFVSSALTAEGVYTAVLLDTNGFGTMTGEAGTFFRRIGDMPGSIMRHCAGGFTLSWKPTEPAAREWRRVTDANYDLGTVYVACSEKTTNIKGAIHITGIVKCRGEYYGAVSRVRRLALKMNELVDEDPDEEIVESLERMSA